MKDYKNEITQYGESLPEPQRTRARELFSKKLNEGKTYQWLYWAIKELSGSDIVTYTGLFLSSKFEERVDKLVRLDDIEIRKEEERKVLNEFRDWRYCKMMSPKATPEFKPSNTDLFIKLCMESRYNFYPSLVDVLKAAPEPLRAPRVLIPRNDAVMAQEEFKDKLNARLDMLMDIIDQLPEDDDYKGLTWRNAKSTYGALVEKEQNILLTKIS